MQGITVPAHHRGTGDCCISSHITDAGRAIEESPRVNRDGGLLRRTLELVS